MSWKFLSLRIRASSEINGMHICIKTDNNGGSISLKICLTVIVSMHIKKDSSKGFLNQKRFGRRLEENKEIMS